MNAPASEALGRSMRLEACRLSRPLAFLTNFPRFHFMGGASNMLTPGRRQVAHSLLFPLGLFPCPIRYLLRAGFRSASLLVFGIPFLRMLHSDDIYRFFLR